MRDVSGGLEAELYYGLQEEYDLITRPVHALRLRGLDAEKRYRVNGGADTWGGAALMAAGYPLPPQRGDHDCLTLYLEAVENS